jgi:hypothetical protein
MSATALIAQDTFSTCLGTGRGRTVFGNCLLVYDEDIIDCLLLGKVTESEKFKILNYPDGPMPFAFFLVDKTLLSDDNLRGHGIVAGCNRDVDCLNLAASSSLEPHYQELFWKQSPQNGYRPMMTNQISLGQDHKIASEQA